MAVDILPECRKKIKDSPCNDQAVRSAQRKCADVSGRGRGRCMDATYERYLEEECAPVLCQEINRVQEQSFQTSSWSENPLITKGEATTEGSPSAAAQAGKSRMFLYLGILGGAGLLVLLATRRK